MADEMVHTTVVRMTHLMRLGGIYVSDDRTPKRIQIFNVISAAVVVFYSWGEVIRFSCNLYGSGLSDSALFYMITILVFRTALAVFITLLQWKIRSLTKFVSYWKFIQDWKPVHLWKTIRRTTRLIYVIGTCSSCCLFVLHIVFGIWCLYAWNADFLTFTLPQWMSKEIQIACTVILHLLKAVNVFTFTLLFLVFFLLVYILNKEFRFLKETLRMAIRERDIGYNPNRQESSGKGTQKNATNARKADVELSVEEIRLQHGILCQMIEVCNEIFGIIIAMVLGISVLLMCFSLYHAANEHSGDFNFSLLMLIGQLLPCACAGVFLIIGGIVINDPAHSCLPVLHIIDTRRLKFNEFQQIQLFVSRLAGNPIGLSAMGMFVVNRESILTILGVVLTYGIVVFEFPSTNFAFFTEADGIGNVTESL